MLNAQATGTVISRRRGEEERERERGGRERETEERERERERGGEAYTVLPICLIVRFVN